MAFGIYPTYSDRRSKTNRKGKRSKFPDPAIDRDTGRIVRFMNVRAIGWAPAPKNIRALNGILSVGQEWVQWQWETTVSIAGNHPCKWGDIVIRPPATLGKKRTFSKRRLIRIGAKSKRKERLTESEKIALFVSRSLTALGNRNKSALKKNMAFVPPKEPCPD